MLLHKWKIALTILIFLNLNLQAKSFDLDKLEFQMYESPYSNSKFQKLIASDWNKTKLNKKDLKKASRLWELSKRFKLFAISEYTPKHFANLIRFVKTYERQRSRSKIYGKYFDPKKFPIQVQIYPSKQVFIIFNDDPKSKSGSQKKFSRSINYYKESISAHLEAKISEEHKGRRLINELKIMQKLKNAKSTLNLKQAMLFPESKKWVLAFQTQVFPSDLSALVQQPTSVTLNLALQAANSLQKLHKIGFVHRDIKPKNYLIREESGKYRLALADFGLSKDHKARPSNGISGTRSYIDPDICLRAVQKKYTNFAQAQKADVFSLGMTLLVTHNDKNHPLKKANYQVNETAMRKNPIEANVIQAYQEYSRVYKDTPRQARLKGLIYSMLNPNSEARISLADVIKRLRVLVR